MIKTLLKMALAALIANAAWRVGSEYVTEFKFKDAVREAAIYDGRSDLDLREHIGGIGVQFDVPVDPDALRIEHAEGHITVEGEYEKPIELIPGHPYTWSFPWSVDADLVRPKPGVHQPTGDTEGRD